MVHSVVIAAETAAAGWAVVGAVFGALLAVAGQVIVRRADSRDRWLDQLLEDCASIYVLEDEFIVALNYSLDGEAQRLRDWRRGDRARAAARIKMLSPSTRLVAITDALKDSGQQLWKEQRTGNLLAQDRHAGLDPHRELLRAFVDEAAVVLARAGADNQCSNNELFAAAVPTHRRLASVPTATRAPPCSWCSSSRPINIVTSHSVLRGWRHPSVVGRHNRRCDCRGLNEDGLAPLPRVPQVD